jgi:hypothetical protein
VTEHEAPSGRAFWVCSAIGTAISVFGAWGLLRNIQGPALMSWVKTFVGGLLVHDALLAPLIVVAWVLVVRVVPRRVRPAVQGGLIVSGVLVAIAIPVLRGSGRLANNPSLLPSEHYGSRLLAVLAVVWAVTALAALRRPSRR